MIKNLLIKLQFEGMGVVNYDSNDQKWMHNKKIGDKIQPITHVGGNLNENVSFSKKVFTVNDEGNIEFKLKVSRDCLIHSMYEKDMISKNPNIVHHEYLFYNYIASPLALIGGYLFPKSDETFKRKSALTLCDAIQTCNALSSLEVFSRAGEKNTSLKDIDSAGDTTFFSKETVGEIKYESIGNIDLMQLQFVSCDSKFDRYSFNADKFTLYKDLIKKRIPNFNSEIGYYQLKKSLIEIPEYGYILSNENILFLVKEILKRLLSINIKRKGAYLKTSDFKIKLVENPLTDTFKDDNNWITLKSFEDIDKVTFQTESFYDLVDYDVALKLCTEFKELVDANTKRNKEERQRKAAEIAAKNKAAKANKNTETTESDE